MPRRRMKAPAHSIVEGDEIELFYNTRWRTHTVSAPPRHARGLPDITGSDIPFPRTVIILQVTPAVPIVVSTLSESAAPKSETIDTNEMVVATGDDVVVWVGED